VGLGGGSPRFVLNTFKMSIELRNLKNETAPMLSSATSTDSGDLPRASTSTLKRRMALIVILVLCIAAVTMTSFPDALDHYSRGTGKIVAKTDDFLSLPLQPKQERVLGQYQYYMLPSLARRADGVLVVLHACQRSGLDFFHLPEDRLVARDALDKNLAVLSLTSQDRESGCFTESDLSTVGTIVDQWTMLHNLGRVPRYGLAMSSGASFLFFAHRTLKLNGMAVYSTPQSFLEADVETSKLIPTAFVSMLHDQPMASKIRTNHNELNRLGVSTQLFPVSPRPFTKALCSARLPELDVDDCHKMFDVLQQDFTHFLDQDGFLAEDMTSEEWQKWFQAVGLDSKSSGYYVTTGTLSGHSWVWAAMEQEIRTCQAIHGMSSEHHSSILEFLIATGDRGSTATGG